MNKILIINGPNLNLLGVREPGIYGNSSMDDCVSALRVKYPEVVIEYFQSNHEGVLVDMIQQAYGKYDGI